MERRYATLDGMRGIAALIVALYHFQLARGEVAIPGYLAVDLFFVLSGFVIALNYAPRFAKGLSLGGFARARLVRLYPLYLAGLVIGIVAQAFAPTLAPQGVATATLLGLFLLPDPFTAELFPLNGPSWSLFFELLVNLVFALGLWRLRSRWILLLMAGAALLLTESVRAPHFFNLGWEWASFNAGLARTLYSFAAGVLLWRWLEAHARQESTAALLPVLAMVGTILVAGGQAGWQLLCVCLAFPALVALGSRVEPPAALRPVFGWSGDISYAVYVVNLPLAAILMPALSPLPTAVAAAAFLAATIALSWALVRFYDVPVRAALNARRARRLTTRRPAAP